MNLAEYDLQGHRLLNLRADSWDTIESAYRVFRKTEGVEIAPVACHPDSGFRSVNGNQTVESWLANDAKIPIADAVEIIDGFPIRIARRLNQIAMNPCRFLGLASSIARSPKAIVFSTAGMDPMGFTRLHEYATKHFSGTLVHLDISTCDYCQKNGTTLLLTVDLALNAG
jgi:hypothetical protein